uniref:Threonine aspartase n=1 Tax=Globodera rostochiensis TaxID=31243 RepID=A0A914H3I3_GLORO
MFIALHAGAGFFTEPAENDCSEALKRAIAIQRRRRRANESDNGTGISSGTATASAVGGDDDDDNGPLVDAVMFLERCATLNCGFGSNLTVAGTVECEAAYMNSRRMAYGAVAVVGHQLNSNNNNSSCCSTALNNASSETGLIRPMVLAGPGADKLCASLGIGIVPCNGQLRSDDAVKAFQRAKKLVASTTSAAPSNCLNLTDNNSRRLDTVGGVAIDPNGVCEACVSSGGILLKREGRLGHSAQFGAAIWAEQCVTATASAAGDSDGDDDDDTNAFTNSISVAVSVSGCGEALTRTHFAEALAQQILTMDVDDDLAFVQHINRFLELNFVRSRRLCAFPPERRLLGGLVAIQQQQQRRSQNGGGAQNIRRFMSRGGKDGHFSCTLFPVSNDTTNG